MVLVGVALAAGLSAVVHWVLVRASIYQAQDAMVWLSGSLNSVSWGEIARLLVLDARAAARCCSCSRGRCPCSGSATTSRPASACGWAGCGSA